MSRPTICLNRKSLVLAFLGTALIYFFFESSSIIIGSDTHAITRPFFAQSDVDALPSSLSFPAHSHLFNDHDTSPKHSVPKQTDFGLAPNLPETTALAHAPGWTLYRNLYMANGTLFLVTSNPSSFPDPRYMISRPLVALNNPKNIADREPSPQEISAISPEEAKHRWGVSEGERNRVLTVEGNTVLNNDPAQFLDHYYHFVGEFMLGLWAFFYGHFSSQLRSPVADEVMAKSNSHPTSNLEHTLVRFSNSTHSQIIPRIDRIIFMNLNTQQWRDKPGFNAYFLKAAFPSTSVEVSDDWMDRIQTTVPTNGDSFEGRVWHFPFAILTDRSASFRGEICGQRNSRIAAEAYQVMLAKNNIDANGHWWGTIRRAVLTFAGALGTEDAKSQALEVVDSRLENPTQVRIVYISRQGGRRHLIEKDHDELVVALQGLVAKKNTMSDGKEWTLDVVQAEKLTKDEQLKVVSRATILLGVHGNGLTHLIFMKPTAVSAVIEIFYPGGFAYDYAWTTKALGMRHYAVWNDTYHTHPNEPSVEYPEGFQGSQIPVHGPTVAQIIEDRVDGKI